MFRLLITAFAGFLAFGSLASAGRKQQRQSTTGGAATGGYASFINATVGRSTGPVALNILTKTGVRNATAPLLYGWMFEDINHSGDGGLYGELLVNRAFEGSDIAWGAESGFNGQNIVYQENSCNALGPVITGYKTVGNTSIRLDGFHPLTHSHQTVLAVDIPNNASELSGPQGFQNMGWWGIPVTPQNYTVSFFVYPDQYRTQWNPNTTITVSLQSNITGEIWASTTIPAQDWNVVNYTYVTAEIVNTVTAPNSNNSLAITFDPVEAQGQTYFFDMISLFGETFKGIKNGLRKDLAEKIYDVRPKFMRWPGGNNLEGYSIQRRWKWWETIGPLEDRWPRPGNWGYYNTNGLGLLEFLLWTESMEMENVLGIYSGYSLGEGESADNLQYPQTAAAMAPLLQEALDELEFCMGSTDTYWGAKRAEYGHPEPFDIKFVEIGNEDYIAGYQFRMEFLYNGLKAKYPNITYISATFDETASFTIEIPKGMMWDSHHYRDPTFFVEGFNFYDNWQELTNNTDVTVYIGEYSVFQIDTLSGATNFSNPTDIHVFYPRLMSAIAEGIYLLGAERNPNVVKLSSYAPSLQNFNWYNWTPNLIAFDADPTHTFASVSYYLQLLFNRYRGTEAVEVVNPVGDFNPLFWVATIDGSTVYLKVINAVETAIPMSVQLESTWTSVNGTILTNPSLNAFNYINNATAVVPVPLDLNSTTPSANGTWAWTVPGWSITVLQFELQ